MSVDRRRRFQECARKKQYKRKNAILEINERARKGDYRDGVTPKAYKCPWCHAWHIGHKRGSKKLIQAPTPLPDASGAGDGARRR